MNPNTTNVKAMVQTVATVVNSDEYRINHKTIKLFSQTPKVYRKIVHLNELNIAFVHYVLIETRKCHQNSTVLKICFIYFVITTIYQIIY